MHFELEKRYIVDFCSLQNEKSRSARNQSDFVLNVTTWLGAILSKEAGELVDVTRSR